MFGFKDIECPYCEHEQNIDHDDGAGYEENIAHQQECDNCGKTFIFYTEISFSYNAQKADCLNDGEHDYKPTCTIPIEFTEMQCSMCDETRKPTEEEMSKILSGELKRGWS